MSLFPSLSGLPYIALDTETTGLGFTDRPVGSSISTPRGDDYYFSWAHGARGDEGNNCTFLEYEDWLTTELRANPQLTVIMFNAGYDLRMLGYKGIKITNRVEDAGFVCALLNELEPEFNLDFLSSKYTDAVKDDQSLNEYCARRFGGKPTRRGQAGNYWKAPGDVVAPYAKSDSRATLRLWQVRRPLLTDQGLDALYEVETAQIPILHKMHQVGVRVDQVRAHQLIDEFQIERDRTWFRWKELTGGVSFASHTQLADLFDRLGVPFKRNPETGNGMFDKEELALLGDYEVVKLIREQRSLKHYQEVFVRNYVLRNIASDGCIHGEFHPLKNDRKFGTVSGRYSSGGALNLQNIPKRDPIKGPMIRSMYVPYYDEQDWVKFDYSQIEYRFLAHYAGGGIERAFRENPHADFHQTVADMVGWPRDPAKTLNFALVYGQGEEATAAQLKVPLARAQDFIRQYNAGAPEIRELYNLAMNRADSRGTIITWGGRVRRFRENPCWAGRHMSTHKGLNALLQGSAADLIKMAMIRVFSICDWEDCILHLTVHDELDFSMTRGAVGDRYRRQIKEAMQDFQLNVPIIAECDTGGNWGHVKGWEDVATA